MRHLFLLSCLFTATPALADDAPPELAFFSGATIVAQHHFRGPANPRRSAYIRSDGRVLFVDEPGDPGFGEPVGDKPESKGLKWREAQIDSELVKKIARVVAGSNVCKSPSTPGFSVGGAWMILLDFGDKQKCSYRRRAHLEVPAGPAKVRKVILDALSTAKELHTGNRESGWPEAATIPL
jgi:hypothetical protein